MTLIQIVPQARPIIKYWWIIMSITTTISTSITISPISIVIQIIIMLRKVSNPMTVLVCTKFDENVHSFCCLIIISFATTWNYAKNVKYFEHIYLFYEFCYKKHCHYSPTHLISLVHWTNDSSLKLNVSFFSLLFFINSFHIKYGQQSFR